MFRTTSYYDCYYFFLFFFSRFNESTIEAKSHLARDFSMVFVIVCLFVSLVATTLSNNDSASTYLRKRVYPFNRALSPLPCFCTITIRSFRNFSISSDAFIPSYGVLFGIPS